MRIPRALTVLSGFLTLALLLGVAYIISRPTGSVITEASFGAETITPNADGNTDATTIRYRIRREATLSIYFKDGKGNRYDFRRDELRSRGTYQVLFSGIVDGFTLDGEHLEGQVLARLLPDGAYTWVIEAHDQATGLVDRAEGILTIKDADPLLPDLYDFTISPGVFTPNQDGLSDRVWIDVYVPKEAQLQVFLIDDQGTRYFVPEAQQGRIPGEPGRHSFEYDGGVDMGASPPPDSTYSVLVEATDAEGQRVQREGQLTIQDGGVPLAEIVGSR